MAASTPSVLRRALLYGTVLSLTLPDHSTPTHTLPVPASSQKMMTKSLALTADNITYDLEDSVTPSNKSSARQSLHNHLSTLTTRPPAISELAVRINAVSTPHALSDLTTLASLPNLDTIVIPKVNSPSDLHFVTDVLRHVAPHRHHSSSSPPAKMQRKWKRGKDCATHASH